VTHLRTEKPRWLDVDPARAAKLTDARLQLHHAAQLVAAMGISYLPKAADDSHTNMQWIDDALASNPVGTRPFRVGVRPDPLSLIIIVGDAEPASFSLHARTIAEGAAWIASRIAPLGLDPARFTLAKHYTIADHPVAHGAPFDTSDSSAFEQLHRWYGNAANLLADLAADGAWSPVRCWPHHFDIAMLLNVAGGSIGVGLEPGDGYYDEPYWYVNRYPAPADAASLTATALAGDGQWHSREWIGAVLVGSALGRADQRAQSREFVSSAVETLRASFDQGFNR
jgi:hypothetical protein